MGKYYFFFVNGQEYYTDVQITIYDLINYFNYNPTLLIIEYNSFICRTKTWKKIFITNKSQIEIITVVGGG